MTEYSTDLRDRPVFICGHPKSGTSLVRAIFDSHPQLVVYPEETIFFRRFLPRSVGLDVEAQLELAEQTILHIFEWNSQAPPSSQEGFPDRDYSAIAYEEVRRAMRELVEQTYRHPGDILSAAALAYGRVSGQSGKWWVEKSPYNEYYSEQIFTWWPEARCVHVLRDPRDNYLSYRRKHPDWSAEFFAANWRRSARAGVQNQRHYGAQRYRLLRYEDLTCAPEESLEQLAGYLEIDWDISLASPTRAGEGWAGNSMFADQFQGISAAPVARWKEQLSPQEAAVIERMAKPLLEHFGYPTTSTARGAQAVIAGWRAATWPIRRHFRRRATRNSASDRE
ncbi:MAG: sulfotransferase [Anaerolineales bacterium]|nr:sulfotransferase [Anaerolineales bacterium]